MSDRFFVRRTVLDPSLPAATAPDELEGVVSTPVRTLGTLTVAAPSQLEAFATVSGDANPIHRSDLLARFVGLPGRIVHGMWTSAAATRAVLESAAEGESSRLREWTIDFVAPVLPGQEVTFTVTRTGVRDGARIVSVEATTEAGVVAMGRAVVAGPRTMYVFPGQGIQSQGMGMEAYARSAAARQTWDRADAATRERMGFSILQIVRDNPTSIEAVGTTYRHPAGVLHLTQFTQVAMATLAMATVAEMREAGVFDPDAAVAGHSVGEYNALGASNGVLTLEGAIELVFARGQGMHGLVPRDAAGNSDYRLAVIRPHLARLSHAQAEQLVAAVAADTGELCEIVNHNLRGKQYAVAGTLGSLAELEKRIGPGVPGRPPMLLVPGIDVPFHSSALLGGVADFRKQLMRKLPEHIDTEALVGRYIPNLYPHLFRVDRDYVQGVHDVCASPILADILADWDAASADRDALSRTLVIELLAWQFASPVRWIETFELMCTPVELGGLGVERIVEIGVGSAPTLANLAKGSLALPTHRGTRPEVLNVEVDAEVVFDTSEDPAPVLEVRRPRSPSRPRPPRPPQRRRSLHRPPAGGSCRRPARRPLHGRGRAAGAAGRRARRPARARLHRVPGRRRVQPAQPGADGHRQGVRRLGDGWRPRGAPRRADQHAGPEDRRLPLPGPGARRRRRGRADRRAGPARLVAVGTGQARHHPLGARRGLDRPHGAGPGPGHPRRQQPSGG